MLNVTLNESEIINQALEGKYNDNNLTVTLRLLIKYYYLQGMNDRLKLREQILNFLKNNYRGYKRPKWEETVTKMVDNFLRSIRKNKVEVKIVDINQIKITKGELEKIKRLSDIKLEKIAFVMLVYAKISNIVMNSNEGWINIPCGTICKEAKVNLKGVEKERIFNELYKIGYIEQRVNNSKTNIKVCYIDEESDIEMVISDFEGVIYQYLIWNGEKWRRCECCSKWIKPKNNKQIYCNQCAKEKELEKYKKYNKKRYKMGNNH